MTLIELEIIAEFRALEPIAWDDIGFAAEATRRAEVGASWWAQLPELDRERYRRKYQPRRNQKYAEDEEYRARRKAESREWHRRKRASMTPGELAAQREKNRLRMRAMRAAATRDADAS